MFVYKCSDGTAAHVVDANRRERARRQVVRDHRARIKGIGADMVTLGFDRDIILDPFGIVDDKEKPEKNKKINENSWITDVAEGQRYKVQNKPGNRLLVDKITLIIGVATLIIVLAIAGRAVWG